MENKRNFSTKPDKLDPIIAALEAYVCAVEKYQESGSQAVAQHHQNNITLLKRWDRQSLH
ncbi:MAG: hypothetical protein HQL72_01290 [Magnetococcales bacterium]|nr:hypothetical protein [Magnetococcales bacterium]